ncbi:MAG: hypothetical protein ACI9TH_003480, partial [Kiritimatiellia bacterium]
SSGPWRTRLPVFSTTDFTNTHMGSEIHSV